MVIGIKPRWRWVAVAGLAATVLMAAAGPPRPRDPFVFRSVIDQKPRMITTALDESLWVSWDTQTGALYRAWDGDVDFTGAVYDTRHGPQPRTQGDVLFEGPGGETWAMRAGQTIVPVTAKWVGHVVHDNAVALMFDLQRNGRTVAGVLIEPEAIPISYKGLAFRRIYRVTGLRPGVDLLHQVATTSLNGTPLSFIERSQQVTLPAPHGGTWVVLDSESPTKLTVRVSHIDKGEGR